LATGSGASNGPHVTFLILPSCQAPSRRKKGLEDLSSTIGDQRDELLDFLVYLGRFILFIWIELPAYFFRKRRAIYGLKTAFCELSNYLFIAIAFMVKHNFRTSLVVFVIPLFRFASR
jgi:hypothetical protein